MVQEILVNNAKQYSDYDSNDSQMHRAEVLQDMSNYLMNFNIHDLAPFPKPKLPISPEL